MEWGTEKYPLQYWKWFDPETGDECLVCSGPLGALCGYVQVPKDHPWNGVSYRGEVDRSISVHGALTFSGTPQSPDGGLLSGHWFGFDCAHSDDLTPALAAIFPGVCSTGTYRTIDYVEEQCHSLAVQLQSVAQTT